MKGRRISRHVTLAGGRQLGYDDHGPPGGRPVFLFHGTPSSRCGWHLFGSEALARRLGIRVIAPDRPGLGNSDWQPGRRIGDWPADVAALADALGIERFAVLGYSGGAPYVLACALQIPERLTAAGLVGGTGQYDLPGATAGIEPVILHFVTLARERPQLAEVMYGLAGTLARHVPSSFVAQARAVLPECDREMLARPRIWRAVIGAYLEALRPGPHGVCHDAALMVGSWSLDVGGIRMPVHLWHGEEDRFVSPAMVRYLVEALPDCRARFYPGEGHVSLLVHYPEEILGALATAEARS